MKYSKLDLGTIEAIVNKLGGMEGVQRFLRGETSVTELENLIDCDTQPFIPNGWSVEEHVFGGQFSFNPTKVELYLSKKQKNYSIIGSDLRKELKGRKVLNANVLDYLLVHPELIPNDWRGKCVFFWGTIYRDSDGRLYVRYLDWYGFKWSWRYCWLDGYFYSGSPAILAVS